MNAPHLNESMCQELAEWMEGEELAPLPDMDSTSAREGTLDINMGLVYQGAQTCGGTPLTALGGFKGPLGVQLCMLTPCSLLGKF